MSIATSEQATVTSASPLLVQLDSGDTQHPSQRLASYTPTLNDRVAVVVHDAQFLVIGQVV